MNSEEKQNGSVTELKRTKGVAHRIHQTSRCERRYNSKSGSVEAHEAANHTAEQQATLPPPEVSCTDAQPLLFSFQKQYVLSRGK